MAKNTLKLRYGAISPHIMLPPTLDIYIYLLCGKFREFWSIPSPSKSDSCFMAKNASPWQHRSMKIHNLYNKK